MATELTKEIIEEILQGIAIPPQPQVMVDLQMIQQGSNCSIEDIATLISQDVGLSGSILKTVNSPFFKHRNKITSITQAASLLGIDSVVNLVNAQSIRGALSDEDIISLGRFWDSATEVAHTSATIAKEIGFPSPDEAYTLGLFHNCGIPLLLTRFENYSDIIREAYASGVTLTEIENKRINTNHAVVGYFTAKSWNLPDYLCEAIHEHHKADRTLQNPTARPNKKTLLAILKMAEHICGLHRVLGEHDADYEWEILKEQILLYIGFSEYDYDSLEQQMRELGMDSADYYGSKH